MTLFLISAVTIALGLSFTVRFLYRDNEFVHRQLVFPEELRLQFEPCGFFVSRYLQEGRLQDTISEHWKRLISQTDRSEFVSVQVLPRRNPKEALDWAYGFFLAPLHSHEGPYHGGGPTWGSFSGQQIGEYCWHYPNLRSSPAKGLLVLSENCLFKLIMSGERLDEEELEKMALLFVKHLKTWRRPGLFAPFFPGKQIQQRPDTPMESSTKQTGPTGGARKPRRSRRRNGWGPDSHQS